MKALTIAVSFKNNSEEFELYNWINNKSAKAGYIKDLLKKEFEKERAECQRVREN
ncbi:hypothetical protein [Clostridium celatum]|uniref:Uncharacterized protein n=1 Tax=Clostridium celatum DSM 1785 TaxID=545697 RepID=L1QFW9_9CLOT|nr:hypothetical protein [Clostridium celatum]EKY26590.1 hypothetical protein HMPREF0216_01775 [Clostridium celatum DSM 1785]